MTTMRTWAVTTRATRIAADSAMNTHARSRWAKTLSPKNRKKSESEKPASNIHAVLSRLVVPSISLVLAGASVALYVHDAEKRAPAAAFVRRFHVAERRPEYAETIRFVPAADLAGEVAGEVALQDALGTVSLAEIEPAQRELWIDNLADLDREIEAARLLLLQSIRERPGWAYHRSLLGMIEYARARRRVQLGPAPDRWLRPLELAMRVSPNDSMLATFAAEALLESWPHLEAVDAGRVNPIFRAALTDPSFVSRHYIELAEVLGQDALWRLLPDAAQPLHAALQAEIDGGDVVAAAEINARWQRAEWQSRELDLHEIRKCLTRGDADCARSACRTWAQKHSVFNWDTRSGRRQAATVLDSWPNEPGSWRNDLRSDFVNFFLERPAAVDGKAMMRAAVAMSDTPRPILARAAIQAGDIAVAETIASADESRGTFEWTRYGVDRARNALAAGKTRDALAALETISPAAQNECDVVLVRAEIGRASGNPTSSIAGLNRMLWSQTSLPLCIDPEQSHTMLLLDLNIAGEPALVDYGFDGGRSETVFLRPGRMRVAVPLEDRIGRHIFSYHTIAGGNVTPIDTALQ
jgi:hypothetical protein